MMLVDAKLLVRLGAADDLYSKEPRTLANSAALLLLATAVMHTLSRLPNVKTGEAMYPTIGSVLNSNTEITSVIIEDWMEELCLDLTLCLDEDAAAHIEEVSRDPMSDNIRLPKFVRTLWQKQIDLIPKIDLALDDMPEEDVSLLLTSISVAVKQRQKQLEEGRAED